MATRNGIEQAKIAAELAETKRHNQETEAQAERDRKLREDAEWNKRIIARLNNLSNVTSSALGGAARIAASNDFSFYTKNREAIMNLLKFPISGYAGLSDTSSGDDVLPRSAIINATLPTPLDDGNNELNGANMTYHKTSSFVYEFTPYIGDSGVGETPCSISVRNFYSKIRAANSGINQAYDSVDIFMIPLAVDSIATAAAWVEKGIYLATLVNPRDLHTKPYGLLLEHCFGKANIASAFIEYRADIISVLNNAYVQFNALNIPFEMDFVKRHVWMASSIFTHRSSIGINYHQFIPKYYWVYDEVNGKLTTRSLSNDIGNQANAFVSNIRAIFARMLNALLDSQTVAIMSGDMLRAFPSSRTTIDLLNADLIATGYQCLNFVSDIKYLQSIKNMVITFVNSMSELDVRQANVNGNPYLYMGSWSGTTWTPIQAGTLTGPGVPILTSDYSLGNWSSASTTSLQMHDPNTSNLYIDCYDENEITEEDMCYNLSFVHEITDTGGIVNARSEIITSMTMYDDTQANGQITGFVGTEFRSNYMICTYNLYNAFDYLPNTMTTFFGGGTSYSISDTITICARLAQTDFVPKMILAILERPVNGLMFRFIPFWSRNVNRIHITSKLLDRIQEQCMISLFDMSSGNSNNITGTSSDSSAGNDSDKKKSNKKSNSKKSKKKGSKGKGKGNKGKPGSDDAKK